MTEPTKPERPEIDRAMREAARKLELYETRMARISVARYELLCLNQEQHLSAREHQQAIECMAIIEAN